MHAKNRKADIASRKTAEAQKMVTVENLAYMDERK